MKMLIKILSLIFLCLYSFSCKDKCNYSDEINDGIILSRLHSLDDFDPVCYNGSDSACIRDQATYDNFFSKKDIPGCSIFETFSLPVVDFNNNSILVFHVAVGGCRIFNRTVSVDSASKKIYYIIEPIPCDCNIIAMDIVSESSIVVLVPKIDTTFKIIYKLKQ